MRWSLLPALSALLVACCALAVDYSPSGAGRGSYPVSGVSWTVGLQYASFSMDFTDRIVFNFSNSHTVNAISSTSCSSLPGVQLSADGATSYIFDPATYLSGAFNGGAVTFACNTEGHCAAGMKFTATVGSRSPSAAPVPAPSQAPLFAGATHSPVSVSPTSVAPTDKPTGRPTSMPTVNPTSGTLYGTPLDVDFGDGGNDVLLSVGALCTSGDDPCSAGWFMRIKLEYATRGWLGFGVGSTNTNPMIGGHAVCGFVDASKPSVGLYSLTGTSTSLVTLVPGTLESNGIYNASFVAGTSSATLLFDVDVNLVQPYLNLVPNTAGGATSADNAVMLIMAKGGYDSVAFAEHSHPAFASAINLVAAGALSSNGSMLPQLLKPPVRVMDSALAAHIVLGLFAFGLVLPLGALIAQCHHRGTKSKLWFSLHTKLQVLGALCGIGGWIAALVHVNTIGSINFNNSHEQLGLAVIIGVFFQVLNGALRPHVPKEAGMEPSFVRKTWFQIHRFTAIGVLVGGTVNILLGPGVFQGMFLGSANFYSIAGLVYTGQNLLYFIYAVGGCALGVVVLGAIYGIFLRHQPVWQHEYNRAPTNEVGHNGASG